MIEQQPKYRLTQYNTGAWAIEELFIHGAKSKTPGRKEWKIIKYPGNLAQASERLLSLVVGTDAYSDALALKDAVASAEAAIVANIAAYVNGGNNNV